MVTSDHTAKKKVRIFVVDDEEAICALLKRVLAHWGYEVFTFHKATLCEAYGAAQCHCQAGQRCADILLSDVRMAEVSGIEFVQKRKKMGCSMKNIALMSGVWNEETQGQAQDLGCKVFSKPLDILQIRQWLDDCRNNVSPERVLKSYFQGDL